MLPADPPPLVVRGLAWLLIAMFLSTLVAAITVRVPETVRCPFVLAPRSGGDPIEAPYHGVVSEVRVAEGQVVAAGAELFALRSDEVRARHTEFQTLTEDLHAKEAGILKLEAEHAAQMKISDAKIAQAERELDFRKDQAETNRDLTARLERLAGRGIVSQIELTRQKLTFAECEKNLNVAQKDLETAKLERLKLETERERLRRDEAADVQKLKLRIAALKRDLENTRGDLLTIQAPYDAVVISLAQRNAGDVVQSGDELCQLAPVGAEPHVRLFPGEAGLARLAVSQHVRLFFNAFPYQRYGTVDSTLEWISPAAVVSADDRQFTATASLDQTFIRVKNEPVPLRVGMRGEARIIVGSRRLIEYAFEPIRRLRENMQR